METEISEYFDLLLELEDNWSVKKIESCPKYDYTTEGKC